jgi:hypothetical protein
MKTAPSSPPSSSESQESPRPYRFIPPSKVPLTDFGEEKVVEPAAAGKVVVAAAAAEVAKRRAEMMMDCIVVLFERVESLAFEVSE